MKKQTLIDLLDSQKTLTKKNTRQDIISLVRDMVAYHIKDNSEIKGLSTTRSGVGVNLGEVVELVAKSLYGNNLQTKVNQYFVDLQKNSSKYHYDIETAKGEKIEVKFATCDAYAHPISEKEIVDYYLIITYSKKLGGMVFKVPFAQRNEIDINNQSRITINQKAKFLDKELTKRLFAF